MTASKLLSTALAIVCVPGLLRAQAPSPSQPPATSAPKIVLRGDRFQPLDPAAFTPEQKAFADDVLAGPTTGLGGPYNVLLRSPEMGKAAHEFGMYPRFHSTIPTKLNEMAVMMVGQSWRAEFVWFAHRRAAERAGLPVAVGDAIAAGQRPKSLAPDEEAVYNFCDELLNKKQVSDGTFAAMKDKFGEKGVVDLIADLGYFQLVAMLLNTDRYPLPDGVKPAFSSTR